MYGSELQRILRRRHDLWLPVSLHPRFLSMRKLLTASSSNSFLLRGGNGVKADIASGLHREGAVWVEM